MVNVGFFSSLHSCLFVLQISTDGYVSLSNLSSSAFTLLPSRAPNTPPIIAPLWTRPNDMQTFFSNTLDYRVSDELETLSIVFAILKRNNSELANFQLRTAVIATVFIGESFEVRFNIRHNFATLI